MMSQKETKAEQNKTKKKKKDQNVRQGDIKLISILSKIQELPS